MKRLNDIGFADEGLLCLRSLLEKIGNKEGTDVNQTKESFFRALGYFGSLSELRKIVKKETETIKEIRNKLKCIFDSITKEAG